MSAWDRRENNFDFMRLALAVLVIWSHAYALELGKIEAEPIGRWTHGQDSGGSVAVNSFFVMSGFLIAASAQRSRGVVAFLKKRVQRIYPAFVVSALLMLMLLPLSGGRLFYSGWMAAGDVMLQTLRLREFDYAGAFPGSPWIHALNGSTWSIQFEFWCYLGVALMLVLGVLRRRGLVLALFAAAWLLSIAFRVFGWMPAGKWLGIAMGPPYLWARLLPLYLVGVVFYLFRERIPLSGWMAAVSALALVVACRFHIGWTVAFPLAGTYLLFWFAFTPRVKLQHFGRFGDFSYGTYLYGFPVEQVFVQGAGHRVVPLLVFLEATPVVILLAVASWYGVERRFLRAARQKETLVHAVAST